jgi:hypothetical protein
MLEEIVKQIGRPVETACLLIENMLGPPTKRMGDLLETISRSGNGRTG